MQNLHKTMTKNERQKIIKNAREKAAIMALENPLIRDLVSTFDLRIDVEAEAQSQHETLRQKEVKLVLDMMDVEGKQKPSNH